MSNPNPFSFKPRHLLTTDVGGKIRAAFSAFWGEDEDAPNQGWWDWLTGQLTKSHFLEEKAKVGLVDYLLVGMSFPRLLLGYLARGSVALAKEMFNLSGSVLGIIGELFTSEGFVGALVSSLVIAGITALIAFVTGFLPLGIITLAASLVIAAPIVLGAVAVLSLVAGVVLGGIAAVSGAVSLCLNAVEQGVRLVVSSILTAVSSPIVALVDWIYGAERDKYIALGDKLHDQAYALDIGDQNSNQKLIIKFDKHNDSFSADVCNQQVTSTLGGLSNIAWKNAEVVQPLDVSDGADLLDLNIGGLADEIKKTNNALFSPICFFSTAKKLNILPVQGANNKEPILDLVVGYMIPDGPG